MHDRHFAGDAIDDAVARLHREGALDDARVAATRARAELLVKHRGRSRVLRHLQAGGIDPRLAERAVDEVLSTVGEDIVLERALARRLRSSKTTIERPDQFRRIYASLVRQGFSGPEVLALLKARARVEAVPEEEDG